MATTACASGENSLAAAKARGVQLGNPKQAKANKREADRYAKALRPILNELSLRRHRPSRSRHRCQISPRAGRRDEAARHDTGDAEKDGASALALAVSILPGIMERVKGEEMVSSSIGETGPLLGCRGATYSLMKPMLVTAIGFSRLPKT